MTLTLDSGLRTLTDGRTVINLTEMHAALIRAAADRRETDTLNDFLAALYRGRKMPEGAPNSLRTSAVKLRQRLKEHGFPALIVSVFGRGYNLSTPVKIISTLRPAPLRPAPRPRVKRAAPIGPGAVGWCGCGAPVWPSPSEPRGQFLCSFCRVDRIYARLASRLAAD